MAVSKSLRNKIVGLLVLASLILILLPAMMDKKVNNDQGQIPITQEGAIVDNSTNATQELANNNVNVEDTSVDNSNQANTLDNDPFANATNSANTTANTPANTTSANDSNAEVLTFDKNTDSTENKAEVLEFKNTKATNKTTNKTTDTLGSNSTKLANGQNAKYIIQVAVFSQPNNAQNIVNKLKAQGINAYSKKVSVNNKTLYRVYANSSDSKEQLEPIAKKIEGIINNQVKIVANK